MNINKLNNFTSPEKIQLISAMLNCLKKYIKENAMLKIGTKVDYIGKTYIIKSAKVSASGKNMYMLQSATNEHDTVAAFEESLSYYGEFDSNEKESTGSQNNVLKMNLVCMPLVNGIMAYWAKVEEAASYIISLYINNQVISTRVNERSELYTTFTGLAGIDGATEALFDSLARKIKPGVDYTYSHRGGTGYNYYVKVQAENRNGEIIASSEKQICSVKDF